MLLIFSYFYKSHSTIALSNGAKTTTWIWKLHSISRRSRVILFCNGNSVSPSKQCLLITENSSVLLFRSDRSPRELLIQVYCTDIYEYVIYKYILSMGSYFSNYFTIGSRPLTFKPRYVYVNEIMAYLNNTLLFMHNESPSGILKTIYAADYLYIGDIVDVLFQIWVAFNEDNLKVSSVMNELFTTELFIELDYMLPTNWVAQLYNTYDIPYNGISDRPITILTSYLRPIDIFCQLAVYVLCDLIDRANHHSVYKRYKNLNLVSYFKTRFEMESLVHPD